MYLTKLYIKSLKIYAVLSLFLAGYSLFATLGYGNYEDTYYMIDTWKYLLTEGRYVPSRLQGYLVPETLIGITSELGGYYLSNLLSVFFSVGSLFIFYQLLLRVTSISAALLSAIAVGTNPYWIIASSVSMDFIHAAFFCLLGIWLLFDQRYRWAGVAFAVTVSSRITYAPAIAVAWILYLLYLGKPKKIFLQGFLIFLMGSVLFYVPTYFASGLSFLNIPPDPYSGFISVISRFVYKSIYFWGAPAFILLVLFFWNERQHFLRHLQLHPFRTHRTDKLVFHGVFWCVVYNFLMFLRLPHQYCYFLPVLGSVVYLIATSSSRQKQQYLGLLASFQLLYGLGFNLDILQTWTTNPSPRTIYSDHATVQLSLKEGVLMQDIRRRSHFQRLYLEEMHQKWGK